jgi:hypothetical protein
LPAGRPPLLLEGLQPDLTDPVEVADAVGAEDETEEPGDQVVRAGIEGETTT